MKGLGLTIALGALLVAGEASASPDPNPDLRCPFDVVPGSAERVPQNAPAFAVYRRDMHRDVPELRPDLTFRPLRSSTGVEVAVSEASDPQSDAVLLTPKAPLVDGETYTLGFDLRCPRATKEEDRARFIETELIVGPPSALPTEIGTAKAFGPDENGDSLIEITLTPELAAFRPLTMMYFELNRAPVEGLRWYGRIPEPKERNVVFYQASHYSCTSEQSDGEVHKVPALFRAHVAGVDITSDPAPLGVEVEVRCPRPQTARPGPPLPQPNAAHVDGACGCRAAGAPSDSREETLGIIVAFLLGGIAIVTGRARRAS